MTNIKNQFLTSVCTIALVAAVGIAMPTTSWAQSRTVQNEDGSSTIIQVVDGREIHIQKAANGAIVSRTEKDPSTGYEKVTDYRSGKTTTTSTDMYGQTIVQEKSGSTTVETITNPNTGEVTTTTTTPQGSTAVIQRGDQTETIEYDSKGNQTSSVITEDVPHSSGLVTQKELYSETYDSAGNKVVTENRNGVSGTTTYNAAGQVISVDKTVVDPKTGVATTTRQDATGTYTKTLNPDNTYTETETKNGVTTTREKLADGQIKETQKEQTVTGGNFFTGGATTEEKNYVKDEHGNIKSETTTTTKEGGLFGSDEVITKTVTYNDDFSQVTVEKNTATGEETREERDDHGNVLKRETKDADGNVLASTTSKTDAAGNVVSTTTTDSKTGQTTETNFTYSEEGFQSSETTVKDSKGNVVSTVYTEENLTSFTTVTTDEKTGVSTIVEKERGGDVLKTTTQYKDENGNLVNETKNADGSTKKTSYATEQAWDEFGTPYTKTTPVIEQTDKFGNKTTFTGNDSTGVGTTTIERVDGSKSEIKVDEKGGEVRVDTAADGSETLTTKTPQFDKDGLRAGSVTEVKQNGEVVATESVHYDSEKDETTTHSYDSRTGIKKDGKTDGLGNSTETVQHTDPNDPSRVLKQEVTTVQDGQKDVKTDNYETGEHNYSSYNKDGDLLKEDVKVKNPDNSTTTRTYDKEAEQSGKAGEFFTETTEMPNGDYKTQTKTRGEDGTVSDKGQIKSTDANGNVTTLDATLKTDANGNELYAETDKQTYNPTTGETTREFNSEDIVKGETTKINATEYADGSSDETKIVESKDGTVETETHTNTDGTSTVTTTTTPAGDGVVTEVIEQKDSNGDTIASQKTTFMKDGTKRIEVMDASGKVVQTFNMSSSGLAKTDSSNKIFDGTSFQGYTWHGLVDNDYKYAGDALSGTMDSGLGGQISNMQRGNSSSSKTGFDD